MSKRFLSIVGIVAVALFAFSVNADAKKDKTGNKEKKEKAAYVWDWDGTLSGNQEFDHYLLSIDTLWNNLQEYKTVYSSYEFKTDTLTINGKHYLMAYMQDAQGNKVTQSQTNWQVYNCVMAGTNIVLDATNASLLTASASLALPSLGLNSITFAKYIKGGPKVIEMGMKEMKNMNQTNKTIKRTWKAMKNGAIDPASLNYFSDEAVKKMKRCVYIKEIVETDPEFAAVSAAQSAKSEEQLLAELAAAGDNWENSVVLPEDANKSLDDDNVNWDEDLAYIRKDKQAA
mgnify:CR=1 FL=1